MSPNPRRILGTTAIAAAASLTVGAVPALAHDADHPRDVHTAPLTAGLYQSAYSAENDALWVTAAVGREPVESSLLKVDPDTLEIEETYTPPVADPETGVREAVYGVAVDDGHDTVWTTNTRQDSLAVYSQDTGEHLATVPGVAHSREVIVDEERDTVWATGNSDGSIVAFDAETYAEKDRIIVDGSSPAGLALNDETGTVYATDLEGDQIIEIVPETEEARLIPTGQGPISIALSEDGETAYTADQAAGTVSIVDLTEGVVTDTVATGDGPLSVAAAGDTVLVANRDAGTVTVLAADGTVVDELAPGANPNHIGIGGDAAYLVDKSGAGDNGEDQITRVDLDD